MELSKKEYEIYKKISFAERYEKLSVNFHSKNEFNYLNEKVLEIAKEIGYKISFVKKNNFFKFQEKIGTYKIYFNFSLKYSIIELIIGVTDLKKDVFITGGTFGNLYEDIKYFETKKESRIFMPSFENYEELQEILTEAFAIYEDLKTEVLKVDWNEEDMKDSE